MVDNRNVLYCKIYLFRVNATLVIILFVTIINNNFYFLGYGNPGGMDAGGTDFDPGE